MFLIQIVYWEIEWACWRTKIEWSWRENQHCWFLTQRRRVHTQTEAISRTAFWYSSISRAFFRKRRTSSSNSFTLVCSVFSCSKQDRAADHISSSKTAYDEQIPSINDPRTLQKIHCILHSLNSGLFTNQQNNPGNQTISSKSIIIVQLRFFK